MTCLTDLVSQAQLGRVASFEQLVRRYQTKIRAFCSYMLGDPQLGEDAAQEVFIKAYRSLKSFRADPTFSSWLFAIARNHSLDTLRRLSRRPTESFEQLCRDNSQLLQPFLTDHPTGGTASFEARSALRRIFAALPPEQRELLLLREMYGMSYEEISGILHCTVEGGRGRLKRLRGEISDNLRHFSIDSDVNQERGSDE